MRRINGIMITPLLFSIIFIIYTNRALYFSPFDKAYWKDKYEHSQWPLPLSVRTIGDDGLYLYEGYQLIHGGDPSVYNAEVPPLGKYLIGLSILLFNNGYWFGLLSTLALVFMVFLLSRSLVAAALVLFDPLIVNQTSLTMLDSLQSFFLLATLYFAIKIQRGKNTLLWSSLAGVSVGFFAETKAPLFVPLILICFIPLFYKIKNRGMVITYFCISAIIAYLLPYVRYFFLHPSIIDWLKIQKWILSFYIHNNLSPTLGSVITTLLIGKYQNIFDKTWIQVPEFSFMWPAITIFGMMGLVKKRGIILYIAILFIITLSFIPFWTRYIVLILPLLIIGTIYFIRSLTNKKITYAITVVLFIGQLSATFGILYPTPKRAANQFLYDWRYGFFSDMYESSTYATKTNKNRNEFNRFGLTTFSHAQIESVAVDYNYEQFSRFTSPQLIPLHVTYFTRELGSFTQNTTIKLVKEDGRWKVDWTWDNLITGLTPQYSLETNVIPAKRGSIIGSDKKPISYDFESYLISVTPNLLNDDTQVTLNKMLEELSNKKVQADAFHQRTVGNTLGDLPIPLLVAPIPLTPKYIDVLKNISGVTLTQHIGRFTGEITIIPVGSVKNSLYFECCSLLYSATTYTGSDGVELAKNDLLQGTNGGSLIMKDENGNMVRTLISAEKKDGEDVQP